jgi:glycosyltransferase involved in cell wall biosynthesis
MQKKRLDLSLILPCYNEAEHIKKSLPRIISILDNYRYSYEVILIDDKSTDDTALLIQKLCAKNPRINTYFHKKNQGRGATVTEGIQIAKGDVAGFIDIDLEVSPEYIPDLVNSIKCGKTDAAIGRRYYPYDFFSLNDTVRMILSKGYSKIISIFLDIPIKDTESGYKFFDRKKVLKVISKVKDKHWFWDTEIVARSIYAGLRIKEIPVLFLRNPDKTSTVNIFSDTLKYLIALYKFKKTLKSGKSNITAI